MRDGEITEGSGPRETYIPVYAPVEYPEALDFTPVSYLRLDERGIITEADLTAAMNVGDDVKSLLDSPLTGYIHPEQRQRFLSHLEEIFKNGTGQTGEFEMISKTGRRFSALFNSIYEKDSSGKAWCRVSLIDISRRKFAEEALRQSEERYRILYDNNPSMYFTIDPSGKVLSVNQFGAEQLGYSVEELVGKNLVSIFHPEDKESVLEQFELCLENPMKVARWEFRKIHKDGSIMWVKEAARAIQTGEGPMVLVVCEDITPRKIAEEEARSNVEIIERSGRELQEFAFAASHDLQEPLRKIQTFSNMLQSQYSECLQDEARDYLDRMSKAASRMQDMVKGLLNYSRVASQGGAFEKVDLWMLAGEVAADFEARLKEAGAQVAIGELPVLDADPKQMRQLFENLIANALKFRTDRPLRISIHGQPVHRNTKEGEGESWRIFVEDNGIGFDENYLDRIFSLFQRLHGKDQYEGIGVGLAICRRIVERHRGYITAKSSPGEGATFIIMLPGKEGDVPPALETSVGV